MAAHHLLRIGFDHLPRGDEVPQPSRARRARCGPWLGGLAPRAARPQLSRSRGIRQSPPENPAVRTWWRSRTIRGQGGCPLRASARTPTHYTAAAAKRLGTAKQHSPTPRASCALDATAHLSTHVVERGQALKGLRLGVEGDNVLHDRGVRVPVKVLQVVGGENIYVARARDPRKEDDLLGVARLEEALHPLDLMAGKADAP
eukprot:scaffold191214_cov31-Tisochrysis_lutea.AAC.6